VGIREKGYRGLGGRDGEGEGTGLYLLEGGGSLMYVCLVLGGEVGGEFLPSWRVTHVGVMLVLLASTL
jgi:hypothetical protein